MPARRKKFLTPVRVIVAIILLLFVISLGGWLLLHNANVPVLNPMGPIAAQQKNLIIFTLLLSVVVVVPVFVILAVVAWKYREGNDSATYTPDSDGNKWLETLWWGIPIIIIAILSVVTWVSTHQLDPYKPLASNVKALNVDVVALQWKWLFLYPDEGIASVNELRIPAGVPVNFKLTADGPMSSMWIPSLGSQTYAMSGMSSSLSLQADKPGNYRGSNSNINGTGYADMNFETVAMSNQSAFNDWVASVKNNKQRDPLDDGMYEKLVTASRHVPVTYYHLNDIALYNKIVSKYMPDDKQMNMSATSSHDDGEDN